MLLTNFMKVKTIPVTVHVNEEDHKKLRSALILKGKGFSEWVRIIVKDFLMKNEMSKMSEKN